MNPWQWSPSLVRNEKTGRQLPVEVCHLEGRRYQIWLAGQLYEVELEAPGPRRAGSEAVHSHEHALEASMPGTVLALKASLGEEVKAGQVLVVMESMKMELSLESPRAGKVAKILVQAGQLVDRGAILVELEK